MVEVFCSASGLRSIPARRHADDVVTKFGSGANDDSAFGGFIPALGTVVLLLGGRRRREA